MDLFVDLPQKFAFFSAWFQVRQFFYLRILLKKQRTSIQQYFSQKFGYSKTLRLRTWFLRTCSAEICQLGPLYTKTYFA